MHHNVPQPSSPVTSPRISAPGQVFSQVRDVTRERLGHTLHNPARLPNYIAQSRAVSPRARIDNTRPAEITDYAPAPGRQLERHMRLDVQNTPGPPVDAVIDAIQRYLDIRPRREPTADPLDEDSIARHPQQIAQSAGRWAAERYYQFSANGAETYQFRPGYHTWSGRLDLQLENPGLADISTPAARSPRPGRTPVGRQITYDPAYAAQEATTVMTTTHSAGSASLPTVGPPIMTKDPYFNPSYAGQNAAARIRTLLAPSDTRHVLAGAPNLTDDPYFNPAFAARNALSRGLELLYPDSAPPAAMGSAGQSDDPAARAAQAGKTALQIIREVAGPGVGGDPSAAAPPARDPAYLRAMRSIQRLERTMLNARVIGGWA